MHQQLRQVLWETCFLAGGQYSQWSTVVTTPVITTKLRIHNGWTIGWLSVNVRLVVGVSSVWRLVGIRRGQEKCEGNPFWRTLDATRWLLRIRFIAVMMQRRTATHLYSSFQAGVFRPSGAVRKGRLCAWIHRGAVDIRKQNWRLLLPLSSTHVLQNNQLSSTSLVVRRPGLCRGVKVRGGAFNVRLWTTGTSAN